MMKKALRRSCKRTWILKLFFANTPFIHPNSEKIKGTICGVRVETIKDPTMRLIRCLDKLIDEAAKGRAMEKILRS